MADTFAASTAVADPAQTAFQLERHGHTHTVAHTLTHLHEDIARAASVIYDCGVRKTPLEYSYGLSSGSMHVWLKLESEQVTGSFKARGAVNRLCALTHTHRRTGIVTASTGNHALAVTYALKAVPGLEGMPAEIFVPRSIAPVKLSALRSRGAPVCVCEGTDCITAENAAAEKARSTGALYISPYNDPLIMAGQGTIGLEILEQLPLEFRKDTVPLVVLVPTGGGGMAAGIAAAIKHARPRSLVIGCQPAVNDCMLQSVKLGRVAGDGEYVDGDTWSDGTAGGVEHGALTFEAFRGADTDISAIAAMVDTLQSLTLAPLHPFVDAILTVSEEEIEAGMLFMLEQHHKIVEGASATGIAVIQKYGEQLFQGCAVVSV